MNVISKKIGRMLTACMVLALVLTLAVAGRPVSVAASSGDKPVVSVSDDGLHISVDFTAMTPTDRVLGEIEAEDVGAVDIDVNYQIQVNGDDGVVLTTVNGFDPAWIIYEVNAPRGQTLDTLKLTIVGRICDYSPIANAFAVFALDGGFTGEGQSCELNRIAGNERNPDEWEDYAYYVMQANHGTMPTSGSVTDVHEFDLTEAAKGCSSIYIGIYQVTTNCPEWIEYRSLSIDATAVDKASSATDEPATEVPATAEPATDAPATDVPATDEPAVTDVPAVTDDAGTATAANATDGTKDNDKDDNKSDADNKSGSGPLVPILICAGVVVAAAVIAAILIKKKKK